MSAIQSQEICVVGAGPAGAAVALRLAQLGHEVSLIEQAAFPRDHIGESLPPGILPLLDALGVRQSIEQGGFLRSRAAVIHWSAATAARPAAAGEAGFQVDRGRFDAILLEAARNAGVRILQPARVCNPQRCAGGGWRFDLHTEQGQETHFAAFIVDASGRRGLLPGRKQRVSPATLALYAYWQHPREDQGATLVEAGSDAWYWGAPLPDGRFNACVFIDPKTCRRASQVALEAQYRQLLAQSRLLASCLRSRLLTPVQACSASAYQDAEVIGDDFIKVGEAAFAIDPLSSQGVQIALAFALQASIVVHTLRGKPAQRQAAVRFYQDRVAESLSRNRVWAAGFYGEQDRFPVSDFWRQRAVPPLPLWPVPSAAGLLPPRLDPVAWQQPVRLCPAATMTTLPAIQGDWVEDSAALLHPSLERPVAFLGNYPLVPLLASVDGSHTPAAQARTPNQLLQLWQQWLPAAAARDILNWLWRQQILRPVTAE